MPLSTGIFHAYNLDGNSNDSAASLNGADTNITYSAANGKVNQGAGFNGASSTIKLASFGWGTNASLTISFWVNPANNTGTQTFISQDDGSTRVLSLVNATGTVSPTIFGPTITYPNIFPNAGSWNHIAITWDDTGQVGRSFLNGAQVGSDAAGTGHLTTSSQAMWFGTDLFGGGRWFYNGAMDIVNLWTRALSVSEISQLYNSGNGLQYPFVSNSNLAILRTG